MKHILQKILKHIGAPVLSLKNKIVAPMAVAVFLFLMPAGAPALVLHADGEPNMVTWTHRPDPNVVGRWSTSASCVAVSSDCVITTKHQSGGPNTPVELGGEIYLVEQLWNHSTADIRVAKLAGANLTSFVALYEDTNEIGKEIVLGGFGNGRGIELLSKEKVYAYTWDGSTNATQRWGRNKIDDAFFDTDGYDSYVVEIDFDGLEESDATSYECAIANHDSGSGWFIYDVNEWKVAALGRSVERIDESRFRNITLPQFPDPDWNRATRISSYATWIKQTIPEPFPADFNGDEWVDFFDYAFFANYWQNTDCHYPDYCARCDSEPDGDVDLDDLAYFTDYWLTCE